MAGAPLRRPTPVSVHSPSMAQTTGATGVLSDSRECHAFDSFMLNPVESRLRHPSDLRLGGMLSRRQAGEYDVATSLHGDPAIAVTPCHPTVTWAVGCLGR